MVVVIVAQWVGRSAGRWRWVNWTAVEEGVQRGDILRA